MNLSASTKSIKTTVVGVLAVLMAVLGAAQLLLDGDPATSPDWNAVGAAIMAGVGLILARDGDKTSEEVGAGGAQ